MPDLTCIQCNHQGPDVHAWPAYIGGQGGCVPVIECDNKVGCAAQWDEAHGLVAPDMTLVALQQYPKQWHD